MKKLAILFIALFSMAAIAQDLPRIAVYVTGNVGDDEKKALGTRMLASLINSKRYRGIERSNSFLAEIEKEQEKQRSGAIDDGQISELGKQFGVKFVCIADITPAFGEFQVSARIVNVETAEVEFIGESSRQLKSMSDLSQVSDQVVRNMFGDEAKPAAKPKTEPAETTPEPSPAVVVSQAKVEPPKQEPQEKQYSKYRSMQKRVSFEAGGVFVPYSYYDYAYYDNYWIGEGDTGAGVSMGGGGYMRIDFIYVEIVLPDIVLTSGEYGASGMAAVILAKYPIVYEIINVTPIFGVGVLGTGRAGGAGLIFGGKIDVAISEIVYLRSEYLYSGLNLTYEGGSLTSFKIGGGLDIGLGERKKAYMRTELLYNWMGGTRYDDEYINDRSTTHNVDLRAGIGYKWGGKKPK